MVDNINIEIQALDIEDQSHFLHLYDEVTQHGANLINDSPFLNKDISCKYFSPVEFAKNIRQQNKSISLFCINCRTLTSHWEEFKELLCDIGSDKFMFDFIGIT